MTTKAVLAQDLKDLEAEYRYWLVEAISIERAIENLDKKIARYEKELGPERTATLRSRLARTRARHVNIEETIGVMRVRIDDLHARLAMLP
jgi:chromosome segregation ATPase